MAFWAVVAGLIGAKIIHGAVRNARNEVREEWEDRVARAANKILAANGQGLRSSNRAHRGRDRQLHGSGARRP